jgi:hypothetical protein
VRLHFPEKRRKAAEGKKRNRAALLLSPGSAKKETAPKNVPADPGSFFGSD